MMWKAVNGIFIAKHLLHLPTNCPEKKILLVIAECKLLFTLQLILADS
jgi:hypothetical protein